MSAKALLFSQMQPPAGQEQRFNDWYDHDHIPARMVLPGFRAAHRYKAVEGAPGYLATYELDSHEALDTPGYRSLKASPGAETDHMLSVVEGFTRFTCVELSSTSTEEVSAPYLSVVAFAVPDEAEAAFNDWYVNEHVPLLMEAQDWLRVRRYKVVDGDGGPWTHLALHDLASLEVLDSPERKLARSGPLRAALADQPWFGNSGRWVYRAIQTQTAAAYAAGADERSE